MHNSADCKVRVVMNDLHYDAREYEYQGLEPTRIQPLGIPPTCNCTRKVGGV